VKVKKEAARRKVTKRAARRPAKRLVARAARPKGPTAAQAIRRLDEGFMQAAAARDMGALVAAFYAPAAVLMPPNHPAVQGRADIQRFLQGFVDAGLQSITLETTRIESAGALAWGRGTYRLSLLPPGGAPVHDVGKYIVVYRQQARGGWRAVCDIFNSDQPAQ
jgi:ketosteroid isomerase-like protein